MAKEAVAGNVVRKPAGNASKGGVGCHWLHWLQHLFFTTCMRNVDRKDVHVGAHWSCALAATSLLHKKAGTIDRMLLSLDVHGMLQQPCTGTLYRS